MRLFSGPNPVFLKRTGFGPTPCQIKMLDVFYCQPPVVGFDVISELIVDPQDLSTFEVLYEMPPVMGFQVDSDNNDDAEVAFYASSQSDNTSIVGFEAEEEPEEQDLPAIQSFEVFYCHPSVVGFEVETEEYFSAIVALIVQENGDE
jgi:hypothetical protein